MSITSITKTEIARRIGIDHSTVTKILNEQDVDLFRPETVSRVRRAADELGFGRKHRRASARTPLKGLAILDLRLAEDGSHFTRGKGFLCDLSASGLQLRVDSLETHSLPAAPFTIDLQVLYPLPLRGAVLRGRVIRVHTGGSGLCCLGMRFEGMDQASKTRLRDFLAGQLN